MTTRSSSLALCALALFVASPLLSHGQIAAQPTPADTNADTAKAPEASPAPAAAPTPAATPAPAAPEVPAAAPAAGERPSSYTLQPGDTLESVGKQWGLTGRQLQKYNNLTNKQVRRLQIGTVIKVPPAASTSKK